MHRIIFKTVLTLAIGTIGAGVAVALHLPMPFLLGAILAVAVAAVCGAAVTVPEQVRLPMLVVFGLLLGSTITPELIRGAWTNLPIVCLLVPFILAVAAVLYWGLRRFGGFDAATAFFSAVPAGVNEMMLIGRHYDADERALAVHQTVRLFLIVTAVAIIFQLSTGVARTQIPAGGLQFASPAQYAAQLAVGVVGAGVALRLRLPAGVLIGPLVLNAAMHLLGLNVARPDMPLTLVAQIVVGASIGQRFAMFTPRELMAAAKTAVAATAVLFVFSAAIAGIGVLISGYPFLLLLLAFSPGGIAEMGLIALSAGYDAGFVSVMQVCRFALAVGAAAAMYRLVRPVPDDVAGH